MTDDTLRERLRNAARGLCTENPHNYMARGISAGDCLDAADLIAQLQAENERLIAELVRRDANEKRNCINWGPCSRMDPALGGDD